MPSDKILQQKKQFVADFSEKLKTAVAGVVIDYRGLTVEEDTALRRNFREAGVDYTVIKNSLLGFAVKEAGLSGFEEILHGPTAIAYHTEDMVAPAKIAADYIKKNNKISIKLGFMEGNVITLDEVNTLASTPSKEVLIAKLMGSLNAPASSLARLLDTIVQNGVEIPDLIAGKSSEAAPAAEAPAVEAAPEPVVEEAVADPIVEEPAAKPAAEETEAAEVAAEKNNN